MRKGKLGLGPYKLAAQLDCNKGGPKDFKWVTRGTKQAEDKPIVGLGTSPLLTDTHVGPLNSVFSGPSLYEVGESSSAGAGNPAHAPTTVASPKALPQTLGLVPEVPGRCARPPMEADCPFSDGISSD